MVFFEELVLSNQTGVVYPQKMILSHIFSLQIIGTSEQWILPFCHNVPASGSNLNNKTNIDGT